MGRIDVYPDSSSDSGGGDANILQQPEAPTSPTPALNDLWIDTDESAGVGLSSIIGYAEITAQWDGAVSAAEQAVPGLTVNVTVPAGRRLRITGYVHLRSSVAGDTTYARILEDGAQREFSFGNEIATVPHSPVVVSVLSPTAGTHTYSISICRQVGSGFPRLYAAANESSYIVVEDITGTLWPAGQSIGAGTIASEAWTSYVPVLSASTPPTMGSGAVAVGKYIKLGRTVIGYASFKFGTSGAAAGSGNYTITLPFAFADVTGPSQVTIGSGYMFDTSAADGTTIVPYIQNTGSTCSMLCSDIVGLVVAATAPWTWANSDEIRINFTYEAVS